MRNERIRVLIVENNRDLCEVLQVLISSELDMEVTGIANDGLQALSKIQENTPDVIILDMIMPYLDGIGVLARLSKLNLSPRPKVIVLSAFEEETVISKSSKLGADYYILKPFDKGILLNRIRQVLDFSEPLYSTTAQDYIYTISEDQPVAKPINNWNKPSRTTPFDLETEVTRTLHDLGVPTYFKGYTYLKDSIIMVTNDLSILGCVTKSLYPKIADKYDTTNLIVEAAIRYTIQKTWKQGDPDHINRVFGYTVKLRGGKAPTNSSFIAKVAELLRIEMLENIK